MAQPNPMARKHPWLLAIGILAGAVALAAVAFITLIIVLLSNSNWSF